MMLRDLTMKSILLSFLCSCLILTACAMVERSGHRFGTARWSSSDPLSIPYDVRRAQFKKGNLVTNPSFEKGRLTADGAGNKFSIDAWQPVGAHVRWIRQPSGDMAPREVSSGSHAVKIIRDRADEGDAAEGVISDYLPVIPGNYDFTFNIRLMDIASHKRRLGVKLYDAVEIKVYFYDSNRQPLKPDALIPARDIRIDNSDKAFVFSHFWTIEDLPWSRVRGKSFTYPFSEGDVPDATRFVRLFLGLKGTGTMWIDDIDYRYSKWNFTTLERFQPYFERPLALAEKITPTPKSFQRLSDVVYFQAGNPGTPPPLIVLPENPAPAEISAAALLRSKLYGNGANISDSPGPEIDIVQTPGPGFSTGGTAGTRLVLSIGRNRLYQRLQPDLPRQFIQDKDQGYSIQSERVGNNHIVFLVGQTPLANYYAATTAAQLIDSDRGIYHDAVVIDYPDFLSRGFAFRRWRHPDEIQRDLDNIEEMSRYKLNKVYVKYIPADKSRRHPDPVYLRGIQQAGKRCAASGAASLAIQVNPYAHFKFFPSAENLSEDERYLWTHSNPDSLALLKDFFKVGLDAGADTVMLRADDWVPHAGRNSQNYTLYTIEDKNRFVNLQNAQSYIINRLKEWIDRDYPGTRLEFCPPWYSNDFINRAEGKAEIYFKELTFQIPSDVAIVWTGPAVRSLSIDMADIRRFKALIGRWPMIWDNTLYARSIASKHYGGYTAHYPGKVRMCNLFEPYDTYRPQNFQAYSSGGHIYINADAYKDTYKAKLATVADYLWNTSAYNPELSIWKVLCQTYGAACAKELLYFNDAYYGLYQTCLRMEAGKTENSLTDKSKTFMEAMKGFLKRIDEAACAEQSLLQELEGLKDRLERRFEDLTRKQPKQS
jgi:hypothetical protein